MNGLKSDWFSVAISAWASIAVAAMRQSNREPRRRPVLLNQKRRFKPRNTRNTQKMNPTYNAMSVHPGAERPRVVISLSFRVFRVFRDINCFQVVMPSGDLLRPVARQALL